MKLYSILKQVILEAATRNEVEKAVVNHERVKIYYEGDETETPGFRYIEPYVVGVSEAGNEILRAYQYAGVSDTDKTGWKTFRLDKMTDWDEMNDTFNSPISDRVTGIPKYNPNGDGKMIRIYKQAKF